MKQNSRGCPADLDAQQDILSLLRACQPPYIEMHIVNELPAKAIALPPHGLCRS